MDVRRGMRELKDTWVHYRPAWVLRLALVLRSG